MHYSGRNTALAHIIYGRNLLHVVVLGEANVQSERPRVLRTTGWLMLVNLGVLVSLRIFEV